MAKLSGTVRRGDARANVHKLASSGPVADYLQGPLLVQLRTDLLRLAARSGLSPTESGCLFLLLAEHLLHDIPVDSLAAMIAQARHSELERG